MDELKSEKKDAEKHLDELQSLTEDYKEEHRSVGEYEGSGGIVRCYRLSSESGVLSEGKRPWFTINSEQASPKKPKKTTGIIE